MKITLRVFCLLVVCTIVGCASTERDVKKALAEYETIMKKYKASSMTPKAKKEMEVEQEAWSKKWEHLQELDENSELGKMFFQEILKILLN